MLKSYSKSPSWNLYSWLIILSYSILQVLRWRLMPQFMDIYYHLLTAWGFIQAGGYTGWDFWQYAPFGRMHIYPPFFHLALAFLIKSGISKIILAKLFETAIPPIFLIMLWYFVKRNFNERLAFFVMLTFGSSFSFYMSLLNHIPAALAFIFGLAAFDQLLHKKPLSAMLLAALCFYTHIGVSWFFAFAFLFYGLADKEYRRLSFIIFICALILSLPVLFKQLTGLKVISSLGLNLGERHMSKIKVIDYALACWGLILVFRKDKKYRLFLGLFLASFIFLAYPYRFFSAEGYLPIIFLAALSWDSLYEKFKDSRYRKYIVALPIFFMLLFSPTLSMDKDNQRGRVAYKLHFFDSAFIGMLFAKGPTIWAPQEYLSAATIVEANSESGDIIYSSLDITGMALASISERATANSLFTEIGPSRQFDPVSVAKIIIFAQDDEPYFINNVVSKYNLAKIGENKLFILYKNPSASAKLQIRKASVRFGVILPIILLFIFLFWRGINAKNL